MASAIVAYLFVIRLSTPVEPKENPTLVTVLLIACVASIAASYVLKRRMLARKDLLNVAARTRAAYILALALCEMAALFGVVAWYTTGWSKSYVLLALGLAGVLSHYPERRH
jgi:TRAP-type C4-dicarboxylate transport system permease small subunit